MLPAIPLFSVHMSPRAAAAVVDTLASGQLAQGPRVDDFEAALRSYFCAGTGVDFVTVNSGTSALDLAFELADIREHDSVISTPMTCVATNIMLARRKANILWADVDPRTGLILPESIDEILVNSGSIDSSIFKAIVTVDWAGASCDYDSIRRIAPKVPIIEDAAHAFGTTYKNRHIAGVGGDYVAWSFQAIKHLTTGDGGCLRVPIDKADKARRLRWFGYDRTKNVDFRTAQDLHELGFKYHMNDIAATIGLANLLDIDDVIRKHRENAVSMTAMLSGAVPDQALPPADAESSWWLYTIRCERRAELSAHLASKGVQSSPVHRRNDEYTAIKSTARWTVPHPGLDEFASTELAVPIGSWLTRESLTRVADAIKSFGWTG